MSWRGNNSSSRRDDRGRNDDRGRGRGYQKGSDKLFVGALWTTRSDTVHSGVLELFGKDPESDDKIKDIVDGALRDNKQIKIALFENRDQSGNRPRFSLAVDPEDPYAKERSG